jgi:MFS family permease
VVAVGARSTGGTPPWAVYVLVVLLGFFGSLGITTLYSMLPTLYAQYGGRHGISWTVTAYFMVAAVSSALCGRFGDLLGRRLMSLLVLGCAALGALLSGVSSSMPLLILGCALQGTAGSLPPLAIGLAREYLDEKRVPVAIGIIAAAGSSGSGIAYLIAGFVIDRFAARGGFMLQLGVALATMIAVIVLTRKPARPVESLRGIDLPRGVLFAPAIVALLLAVDRGGEWGWVSWRTLACLTFGLATLGYWTRHQARQIKPLIDVRMLRGSAVARAILAMMLLAIGAIQVGLVYALFLQQPVRTGVGFGFSATMLGWFMFANNSVSIVFSPLSGALSRRFGARSTAAAGALCTILAWLFLAFHHGTLVAAATSSVLTLIGVSLLLPALNIIVVRSVPLERTSEMSGIVQVTLMAFMAVGAQILYRILSSDTIVDAAHAGRAYPSNSAYTQAFLYIACASAACFAMILWQRREAAGTQKIAPAASTARAK